MNKNTIILSVVSIAILLALIAYGSMQMKKPIIIENTTPSQMDGGTDRNPNPRPQPNPELSGEGKGGFTACTMEAKQCPDGSSVGRQGPRCEFSPCPGN